MAAIVDALARASRLLHPNPEALLEAETLLAYILGKPRSYLRAWPDNVLSGQQAQRFYQAIEQRKQGMPIAYITGTREFWSREFKVTSDVLIPRPDTETLVEHALKLIPQDRPYKILDLGTGSGIIAITLAAERPLAEVIATDTSIQALEVARENAEHHGVDRIDFFPSHWFDGVVGWFDLIASNPPYIGKADPHLLQGDLRFEPQSALVANKLGLGDIEIIVNYARNHLKPGGYALVEHGYNQQKPVQGLFKACGYVNIETVKDLAANPRVTLAQWQG